MKSFSIVVLISGHGSTLQAIIDRIQQENWPIKISAVISHNPKSYGIIRAKEANIPVHVFPFSNFKNTDDYHSAVQHCIDRYYPDLIVLAGYMRILSSEFIHHYPNKIINIHPSLLPKYKGLEPYSRVLTAKEKEHGTTVHWVTNELDSGPIIAQAKVRIKSNETIESLQIKTKAIEAKFYPEVIYKIASGKIKL